MARKTKSRKTRDEAAEIRRAQAHFERAATDLAAVRQSEEAEAIAEAESFDNRELLTGQPIPGRALPEGSPLEGLRREVDRLEAIAEKMADRAKYAGVHVRSSTLRNVEYAEAEAQRARERLNDREGLALDYGTLQPCRNTDCLREIDSRSTDFDQFGYCRPCFLIAIGASRSQP